MLRKKNPKGQVSYEIREERSVAAGIDNSRSLNFMSDKLFDRRGIRLATIVDNSLRESLAIKVGSSNRGQCVLEVLQRLMAQHKLPRTIPEENGPKFTSKCHDQWVCLNGLELYFNRPGNPTDNAFIEAFNGRFRQEMPEQEVVSVPR